MEWIKCSDRLPHNGEPVVATLEEIGTKKRYVEFDVAWSQKLREWVFINFDSTPLKTAPVKDSGLRVTHWMPMPRPAED